MPNGKTIRLYLVNGSPTEVLTAEIINWTGKIIVTPRSQPSRIRRNGCQIDHRQRRDVEDAEAYLKSQRF